MSIDSKTIYFMMGIYGMKIVSSNIIDQMEQNYLSAKRFIDSNYKKNIDPQYLIYKINSYY